MIDQIEQALSELKTIEGNFDSIRKERNNLLFDNQQLREENEKLRKSLVQAVSTIEQLRNGEEGEAPYV